MSEAFLYEREQPGTAEAGRTSPVGPAMH